MGPAKSEFTSLRKFPRDNRPKSSIPCFCDGIRYPTNVHVFTRHKSRIPRKMAEDLRPVISSVPKKFEYGFSDIGCGCFHAIVNTQLTTTHPSFFSQHNISRSKFAMEGKMSKIKDPGFWKFLQKSLDQIQKKRSEFSNKKKDGISLRISQNVG